MIAEITWEGAGLTALLSLISVLLVWALIALLEAVEWKWPTWHNDPRNPLREGKTKSCSKGPPTRPRPKNDPPSQGRPQKRSTYDH